MPLYNPSATVTDATLSTSDITTNNSSTSKHGFLKKLDNDSAHFMDGTGAWSTPTPTGGASYAAPTFVGVGTAANGTGDITPTIHASTVANDVMYAIVQSGNQSVATPTDWAKCGPVVGIGAAAAAAATRISVFWKRHDGSETDPVITDPGDHAVAQIISIRGAQTTGDPHLFVGATRKTTASTTSTGSGGATPVQQCMVVQVFADGLDSSSARYSSPTNADLDSVTERIDVGTTDGNGGGICVITGIATTPKSFAATTATVTSTTDVGLTFIILPAGITERSGFIDRQVFITAGVADTWTRPTAAITVDIAAIGGGASGSGGRNAATAAGGGGGGGGGFMRTTFAATDVGTTLTVTAGAGGAATAHADGAASNAGTGSQAVEVGTKIVCFGPAGSAAGASGSGSGGIGGNGGGRGTAAAAGVDTYDIQPTGGGTGGTTALAGGNARGTSGGAGAGGGTTAANSAGGAAEYAGAGGGGGRSNTNVGTGGASILASQLAGGASASAAGATSPFPTQYGGSGGAGGTSASGTGGAGGWPGGGGGGGGSQSGAQGGGAGGDGIVVITTYC